MNKKLGVRNEKLGVDRNGLFVRETLDRPENDISTLNSQLSPTLDSSLS